MCLSHLKGTPGINNGFPWLWWENSLWINDNLGVSYDEQSANWLFYHIERAIEIKNYLALSNNLSLDQKRRIIDQHLTLMIDNSEYNSFVGNHSATGVIGLVWWEDDSWINDPANISFEIYEPQPGYQLTTAEKTLVKQYPVAAFFINRNVSKAIQETNTRFGTNGLNDKSDAFRHTFFNAMNERDCGKDNITLASIARKFSDAHETETPVQLQKEKDMDLFNNNVGHQIGDVFFPIFTSDASLANEAWDKLVNGYLMYLKPVEPTPILPNNGINNDFWHINFDFSKGKHGISNSTQLTPTNQ